MRVSSVIADIIQIVNRDQSDMQDLLKDDHTQYALRTIMTANGDMLYRSAGVWTRLPKGTSSQYLVGGNTPSWNGVEDLAIANQASGDILYFNGSNWVRLAKGSAGHCLMTGTPPAWGHPADLTITNQAQGDIIFFDGSNWIRLAAGTDGQYLKTQGAGANPIWVTPIALTESVVGEIVSDDLKNSNDSEKNTDQTSYTKIKEILINADLANVRIKYDHWVQVGAGGLSRIALYKNGALLGDVVDPSPSETWDTKSQDFAGLVSGDLLQIYAMVQVGGYLMKARNFRFYYKYDTTITKIGDVTLDAAIDGLKVGDPISTTNQDP